MTARQQVVRVLVLILSLVLAACAPAATPVPTPAAVPTATDVAAIVSRAEPTLAAPAVVTAAPSATAIRAAADPPSTDAPAARLIRHSPAGTCMWDVYMYLTGFAPNSSVTVMSNYDEVECATGKVVEGASWTEVYGKRTDANGRLMIDYLHEATGSYLYTFTDDQGHQASLPFTTKPEPTATPRAKAPSTTVTSAPAAVTTPSAGATEVEMATDTPAPDPLAVVNSATLNLRSGPGQAYPVIGQLTRGDRFYPLTRVGNCEWLQAGVLGQADLVWVAGGAQFVTLNVPCETLRVQDLIPPVPAPAPTDAPRPGTGLLSQSGPYGSGYLVIKNGTDSDGVVILVDLNNQPVQAAYIRAADSFRMADIGDGSYRLYFSKGEGWDAAAKGFTSNVSRQRFEDTLQFGGQYAGYEVTLYGVAGGNAGTEDVPAGQFPTVP